jgi:hypothetical protein
LALRGAMLLSISRQHCVLMISRNRSHTAFCTRHSAARLKKLAGPVGKAWVAYSWATARGSDASSLLRLGGTSVASGDGFLERPPSDTETEAGGQKNSFKISPVKSATPKRPHDLSLRSVLSGAESPEYSNTQRDHAIITADTAATTNRMGQTILQRKARRNRGFDEQGGKERKCGRPRAPDT